MANDEFQMYLIRTISGKRIDPLRPDIDLIDINDIAYTLSGMYRFGCHSRPRYPVSTHCVLVSLLVDEPLRGLIHDVPEYLYTDIPGPVKYLLCAAGVFKKMDDAVTLRFFGKVQPIKTPNIDQVDKDVMAAESEYLGMGPMPITNQNTYEQALKWLKSPSHANTREQLFLDRFHELTCHRESEG